MITSEEHAVSIQDAWPVIKAMLEIESVKLARAITDPLAAGHQIQGAMALIDSMDKVIGSSGKEPVDRPRRVNRLKTN